MFLTIASVCFKIKKKDIIILNENQSVEQVEQCTFRGIKKSPGGYPDDSYVEFCSDLSVFDFVVNVVYTLVCTLESLCEKLLKA